MQESRIALVLSVVCFGLFLIWMFPKEQKSSSSLASEMPANMDASDEANYIMLNPQARSISTPEKLSFAGEEVPLHMPEVMERFDREIHINAYWHTNTIFLIKRANRYLPMIEPILAKNGIPDDFKYLAVIESGLENVTSPRQAVGFWQMLRGTAIEYGLEVNRWVDERYDPVKSTEAACKYLLKSYEKFGNWTLVAASYNRGMRGIQNAIDDQQVDNYYDLNLNEETARYVHRILASKEVLQQPAKYGFKINQEHLYEPITYRYVEVSENINDLVTFAKEQGITYKALKWHNPWLRDDRLRISRNKTYRIAIPILKKDATENKDGK